MIFYPTTLPMPLQDSYSLSVKPNILRTTMSDGYTRQRLVNQGAPYSLSCTVQLSGGQWREMLAWYKTELVSGTNWFVMPLLNNDYDENEKEIKEITYQYARIQNGALNVGLIQRTEKGTVYKVSMTLDVSNTVVDDGSWHDHYVQGETTDILTTQQSEIIEMPTLSLVDDGQDDILQNYTILTDE